MSRVKIFADPVGLYSRAMVRVATAIRKYAPANAVFVSRPEDADIQFLHVIDWDDSFLSWPRPYIAIQYCLETTGQKNACAWAEFWDQSEVTWSYYDLAGYLHGYFLVPSTRKLFHAPLGADAIFCAHAANLLAAGGDTRNFGSPLRDQIVTSGYVSGPYAEAIEEVWNAAERTGWSGVHIGPLKVEGMKRKTLPTGWHSAEGCTDAELAAYYRRAYYVSGLRYGEGFELPAVEGILCGALPLLFGQQSQQHWFSGITGFRNNFLPELAGGRHLTNLLEEKFSVAKYEVESNNVTSDCTPVGKQEIATALARFNWASIIPDMFTAAGL